MRQPLHIAHFAHTRETPGKGCLLIFRHTRLLCVLVQDDTDNLTFSGVELQYRIAVNVRFGKKQTCAVQNGMSALPPEVDISDTNGMRAMTDVRPTQEPLHRNDSVTMHNE